MKDIHQILQIYRLFEYNIYMYTLYILEVNMNIIRNEREEVILNDNIGTSQLSAVINNMNKLTTRLTIDSPLHGDVDFGILKESGFNLITEIYIPMGKVTSVSNLPKNLKKLLIL